MMQGEYKNQVMTFFDTVISPPRGTFVAEQFPVLVPQIDFGSGFYIEDDFFTISAGTGLAWQAVKGTGGSLALASALGGQINIPTAASQNDYQLLSSQAAHFNLRANKPLFFEVALSCTEAATNKASWFAGLSSTTASGFIQNTGAPAASYSGAIFWKAQGAMTLAFQTSNGSTQNSISSLATVTSGTQYVLGCILSPNDGTTGLVTPYVSQIASGINTSVAIGATQNLTLAGLANMNLIFGVKAGSASAETLVVDWARCYCAR